MKNTQVKPRPKSILVQLGCNDRIAHWCHQWDVASLSVFGSVLDDRFGPGSDVDFLARFESGKRPGLFDLMLAEEQLAGIVGRRVDLLDWDAVMADDNYIRREHLLASAKVIYDTRA